MRPDFKNMTEPEVQQHLRALAQVIEGMLPAADTPRGCCSFVCVIFDEGHVGQYISNARRADIIRSMREFADIMEQRQDLPR